MYYLLKFLLLYLLLFVPPPLHAQVEADYASNYDPNVPEEFEGNFWEEMKYATSSVLPTYDSLPFSEEKFITIPVYFGGYVPELAYCLSKNKSNFGTIQYKYNPAYNTENYVLNRSSLIFQHIDWDNFYFIHFDFYVGGLYDTLLFADKQNIALHKVVNGDTTLLQSLSWAYKEDIWYDIELQRSCDWGIRLTFDGEELLYVADSSLREAGAFGFSAQGEHLYNVEIDSISYENVFEYTDPQHWRVCSDSVVRIGNRSYTESGIYYDTLRLATACDRITAYHLTFEPCGGHFLPTGFSPNGDGYNDTFGTLFKASLSEWISQYHLAIYNRYGEKVFESSDPAAVWDGTYGGKPQPVGVYVYRISYRLEGSTANPNIQDGGNVTLLR